MAEALRGNENLTTLELGYNPIGEAGAKALASVIKYDLKVHTGVCPMSVRIHESGRGGQAVCFVQLIAGCTMLDRDRIKGLHLVGSMHTCKAYRAAPAHASARMKASLSFANSAAQLRRG